MPLTFVHPAAVLTLMRGPLVPAALVAGAVAPDAPYFLRASGIPVSAQSWWEPFVNATTTHGWPGAATVGLPLALATYLVLAACGRPARWALGAPATRPPALSRAALVPVWVLLSLALGILTHVVWDSFTHGDSWVVQHVPVLQAQVTGSLTLSRLLQHLSTALGLVVLAAFAWRRRTTWAGPSGQGPRPRLVQTVAGLLAAAVAGAVTLATVQRAPGDGLEALLSDAAVGAGLGAAVAVAVLAALWWVVRPDRIDAG